MMVVFIRSVIRPRGRTSPAALIGAFCADNFLWFYDCADRFALAARIRRLAEVLCLSEAEDDCGLLKTSPNSVRGALRSGLVKFYVNKVLQRKTGLLILCPTLTIK